MLKHIYTVVARGVSVDQRTNTVSVYSILERIGGPRLPFQFVEMNVLSCWAVGPSDMGKTFRERLRITDPNGNELLSAVADCTPKVASTAHRMIFTLQMFSFVATGLHVIDVSLCEADGTFPDVPDARFPIDVVLLPENAAQSEPMAPSSEAQSPPKHTKATEQPKG